MSLVVGDETGLVKVVDQSWPEPRRAGAAFVQERARAVSHVRLSRASGSRLHCAVASGELETYDRGADDEWHLAASSKGLGDCAGLDTLPNGHALSVRAQDGATPTPTRRERASVSRAQASCPCPASTATASG